MISWTFPLPADPLMGTISRAFRRLQTDYSKQSDPARGTLTAESPQQWIIECDGASPAWLRGTVEAINRAARLGDNWDSYGACRLQEKAALHAIELLEVSKFGGPAPAVSPSKDGGIHLEWGRRHFGLELEITDEGEVSVVLEMDDRVEEWSTTQLGDDRLFGALREVSSRLA
jgi:hypothetical protein